MIRVGILGLGGVGRLQAEVFSSEPLAQLIAVCDHHEDRRDAAVAKYRCHAYPDLEAMLAAEAVDLVSVCTGGRERGGDHYSPTMAALDAGVHVLVEKPMSNRLDEAEQMVAKARANDRVLAVNLNHRFSPAAHLAKEWIDGDRLGELMLAYTNLWVNNPADETPYYHLIELHSHSVDMMRYFCGDIVEVQAFLAHPDGRKCWSNCSLNLRFASGAVGCLQGSYDMSTKHSIEHSEIAGTRGRLTLDNVYETLTFYPNEALEATVVQNPILGGVNGFYDTFRYRIRALLQEITHGLPISASGEDGLAALRVITAAIRSFEEQRIVKLDED